MRPSYADSNNCLLPKHLWPRALYHVLDRKGRVVYVGVTLSNLSIRMSGHRSLARSRMRGGAFIEWLRAEMEAGRDPKAVVVGWVQGDFIRAERDEIVRQLRRGQPLLNTTLAVVREVKCRCPKCGTRFAVEAPKPESGRLCPAEVA